ncbi:MAG: carbohydrate ABC transporter permease [Defluviitaleaceae bacterium]|nr:carbohydrate ABC transporter permease [Defluviitaleaceae bacterium]
MTKVKSIDIKAKKIKYSSSDKIFYGITGILLCLLFVIFAYPLIYVVSASFSSGAAVSAGLVVLWPVDFSLEGYSHVFAHHLILSAYWNTIRYTVVGTLINIALVMITAYPLSRADLKGRNFLMLFFVFTMLFSGGMIPWFLLIRDLGILNSMWAIVLPGGLPIFLMIIARTFIQSSIPHELLESAQIDGCSDARYFFSCLLPLSKAVIAVITLFAAVGHWNSFFPALMLLTDRGLMPLQIILREILILNQIDMSMVTDPEAVIAMLQMADVIRYALIVVATAPILMIYPFAQKYFVKGVMVGSLKG